MGGRNVISDEEDEFEDEVGGREAEGDEVHARDDEEDDEEEEEEGQDEYEKDGFIVDDVEEEEQEEEEEDQEELRSKKKKRRKRETEENYELDEDDYELLQEANVTGFHRPKPGSKKFKRLKKAGRNNEHEEGAGFTDDEEINEIDRSGRTAEEKLKRSLFGDDEGVPQDIAEEEELQEDVEEEEDIGEEDEMADFIVDEEEVDENGVVMRKRRPKKKILRQAPGVSSSALQEAHDIFGDVDELLLLRKQGLKKGGGYDDSGDWREKRLEDEFEPSVIKEKYLSEKDNQIRDKDMPERIQLFEEMVGPIPEDDESIQAEATWIFNQLSGSAMLRLFGEHAAVPEIDREDIANVLGMLHVQKFEIPFIAMYRKELCLSLLRDPVQDAAAGEDNKRHVKWHKLLWAVHNLDKKWLLLQKRKNSLQLYYKKRASEEANIDVSKKKLLESLVDMLKNADSERVVDDIDLKFNLHFPPDEVDAEEGQFKRPKRKSLYSICRKAGLGDAAGMFGLSPEKFGKLLGLEEMGEQVVDARETPEEVALKFQCREFETPQDVLKGARHMAAVEISCEPSVRKHVRDLYVEHAFISTKPTHEGNAVIDSFHPLAAVKWLRDKPVSEFCDAQWLLIQKAEEEKLLQVTIRAPDISKLEHQFYENYLSDSVSRCAQLWNEQRKLVVKDALFGFLLPSMEKEARALLTARAKSWLLLEYGSQLWSKVSVAPYKRKENDAQAKDADDEVATEEEVAPRVMACCWGPGKPATTFVMLDSSGEVLDVLYTGFLSIRSQSANHQQRKKMDQERLLKFMTEHHPHVVVLGAVNLSCPRLKDDIFEVIFKIVEDHPYDVGHEVDELSVVYGDESLPRLYENSRVSLDQLPAQQGIVRRAVALGRYLQNPLAMVATLCGPGREILSWKLNLLESYLTPDEKYEMIEQVLVDVTNQVGIDVNLAACHEWLFAPLQFVSGLGPRKASSLQRAVVGAGRIYSRKEIPMNLGVLKRNVFMNAAGFLRVRGSGQAALGNHVLDLLDDTRIHPESYDLARKMAKDVYAEDVGQDINDLDEDAQEMAIEQVRGSVNLKRLDIDAYSGSIELHLGTSKRETLYDIKMELLHGFTDWRAPYSEPTQDEEFYMISGETPETLAEGRLVQATVRRVQGQRIFCELESGLMGLISKEDFSDERDFELTERVAEGSIVTCKIKFIRKDRHQVILTCKGSDLRNNRLQSKQPKDPYYAEDESSLQNDLEKARKEKELAKKSFKPRMIVHPRFQNVTADEAISFLADKEAGESIIRPSSRGPQYLTLTLKVHDGVYAHKDIIEGDKDQKDITSLLRLGKTLKIGEDTFEDLDEVMDRYVDPLVANLRVMLGYRKFRRGSKGEVDEDLRHEKAANPMRIVYSFGVSQEHPGTFILSYIRSSNPHHEYIGLYPKGFKFRSKMFESLDRLVAYFQRHIDDLQHSSVPPIRSVAAMVPLRSPASGGGSVGSGWGGSTTSSGDGWRTRGHSDRDRSATPASRTGRGDYRNGNARDGHPSGLPRPYGNDRGRGGRGGRGHRDGQDSFTSNWGQSSDSKDGGGGGGGWGGSFGGTNASKSPSRGDAPGTWGSSGAWGSGGAEWGEPTAKNPSAPDVGDAGWEATKKLDALAVSDPPQGVQNGSNGGGAGGWGASGGRWAGDPDVPGGW
ncbi:Transcription elongation factor [Nymphaea thermarum]|nr:Transcription elongation factor [Nymphaea thermarum]